MERRFLSIAAHQIQLENRGTEPPNIVGMASVFYNSDDKGTEYQLWADDDMRCVERILPTAFDRILRDKPDVLALFNHEADNLLGRTAAGTLKLDKTPAGLRYRIECNPQDADHQRVLQKIQRKDLTGSSFSFMPTRDGQTFIRTGGLCVREIHDCDIYDVGPVSSPAYASTTTGMRAAGGVDDARDAFKRWSASELAKANRKAIEALLAKRGL